MTTATTARADRLRKDIEGAFALSAASYARGDYAAAANFTRQVNEMRDELNQIEEAK
jgi:hypothetical protein